MAESSVEDITGTRGIDSRNRRDSDLATLCAFRPQNGLRASRDCDLLYTVLKQSSNYFLW